MATYQVPVIRTVMDVYQVEATSDRDAAVEAGVAIATKVEPFRSSEQSRRVLKPVRVTPEFLASDASAETPATLDIDADAGKRK